MSKIDSLKSHIKVLEEKHKALDIYGESCYNNVNIPDELRRMKTVKLWYKDEIHRLKTDPDGYCKVWREFQTEIKPNSWIVWPHSESQGWSKPITGLL